MPRNFSLSSLKWKDPRVAMRAVLGVLLLANLVAAVVAFKPFGGGADDLRRDRNVLQQQLVQLEKQVAKNRKLVEKVSSARSQGDQFLAKYFTDRRVVTSTIQSELVQIAKDAGIFGDLHEFALDGRGDDAAVGEVLRQKLIALAARAGDFLHQLPVLGDLLL